MILGRFWDANGGSFGDALLDLYEDLLGENDHDLYLWISGQAEAPSRFSPLIGRIRDDVVGP